jgi:hypothetical protein
MSEPKGRGGDWPAREPKGRGADWTPFFPQIHPRATEERRGKEAPVKRDGEVGGGSEASGKVERAGEAP